MIISSCHDFSPDNQKNLKKKKQQKKPYYSVFIKGVSL